MRVTNKNRTSKKGIFFDKWYFTTIFTKDTNRRLYVVNLPLNDGTVLYCETKMHEICTKNDCFVNRPCVFIVVNSETLY